VLHADVEEVLALVVFDDDGDFLRQLLLEARDHEDRARAVDVLRHADAREADRAGGLLLLGEIPVARAAEAHRKEVVVTVLRPGILHRLAGQLADLDVRFKSSGHNQMLLIISSLSIVPRRRDAALFHKTTPGLRRYFLSSLPTSDSVKNAPMYLKWGRTFMSTLYQPASPGTSSTVICAARRGHRLRTEGLGLSMSTTYCEIHLLSSRDRSSFSFQLPICSRWSTLRQCARRF